MSEKAGKTENKAKKPSLYIRTFGCQMNVRDSEVIAGLLHKAGYKITDDEENADVVIFNTCSVRQHAEDKVWSAVGATKEKIIGIAGCMANNYREEIFHRSPQVDFAVGTADIAKIPAILKEIEKHKGSLLEKKIYETDSDFREDEIYHTGFYLDKEHAFVVISEGCENYCSYCIVPYVRGKLRSRDYKDIIKEIEGDIAAGISKITLLGQNVNAYQYKDINFVGLVKQVNLVKGLKEFSFVTSHPKDTGLELFKAMAECDKLKKYLHLPVQSGSNRILGLMNRGYTREHYLELAEEYRKIVKGAQLTTDIIVGFPTETEQDFQDTFDLAERVEFNAGFIFKYSPRPRTASAGMPDDVPKEEKERRHSLILELQKKISRRFKTLISVVFFTLCTLSFTQISNASNLDNLKVLLLKQDYKQTIVEGEKILADPRATYDTEELYYILGISYLKDGNYLRAWDIFEIILKEFKDTRFKDEAKLGLGDTFFLRGDLPGAQDRYKELFASVPNTKLKPQIYYRLSQIGFKLGNIQQGKDYADKLKQEFPDTPESMLYKDLYVESALTGIYYTVQVGSFANIINANTLSQRLIKAGYPVFIEETNLQGKAAYRVRVGKMRLRSDAENLQAKLTQEGYPTRIFP